MKILLITWACDRDDVSEPLMTYKWVKEISRRHEVTLFSVSRPDRFGCVKEQFPNIPVYEWRDIRVPKFLERFRSIVKPGYFFYFRKARKFLRSFLANNHFDIVHHITPFAWRYPSPAYNLGIPLIRGPLAGGLPTPKPLSKEIKETFHPYKFLRFTDNLRKKWDYRLRASYKHTNCVLAAAPYVLDLLQPLSIQHFEIEIELGYDGNLEENINSIDKFNTEKTHLLFVGRVIRTKGVRDAIQAINYMKNREKVTLTIIGDGEDLEKCKNLVNKLKLTELVHFRGWCNKEEVALAYQQANIFIFPSFREPTGGVLLEAMSYGLPCITCDYGGPSFMIPDDCGIKVPPMPPQQYARQIAFQLDRLIDSPALREQMKIASQKHVKHYYCWATKMNRMDIVYQKLTCFENS